MFDSVHVPETPTTPGHRSRPPRIARTSIATAGAMAIAVAGLTGCSSSGTDAGTSASASTTASAAACPVTVTDAWVKAADSGMTSAFGTLTNASGEPVTVTGVSSPAAGRVELHEVADVNGQMTMRQVAGGFSVPANGSLTLEPGGYHLMLMDLTAPVKAGDEVTFTVTCGNAGTFDFAAQAKSYTGAAETYDQGGVQSEAPSGMSPGTPSGSSSMSAMPSADSSPQPMEDTAPSAGSS